MDNKIVSTTYVPLPPPYQIIKYGGDIAMQIGTLIVTIQKEGNANGMGYQIETHSHPVVAYENKEQAPPDRQLATHQFLEGAVWNFVEVKDVTTVCLSNSRLSWMEFVEFLWRDLDRRSSNALPTIGTYWMINKLCKGIEKPQKTPTVVRLTILYTVRSDRGTVLCSTPDSPLALSVPISNEEAKLAVKSLTLNDDGTVKDDGTAGFAIIENGAEIMKKLEHQLEQYRRVLTYLVGDINKLNYTFHCVFPRFRIIADRLNEAWEPYKM